MRRSEFIAALTAWPLVATTQQQQARPVIGFVSRVGRWLWLCAAEDDSPASA